MKQLTQIFQALLSVVALILTAVVAFGRLAWSKVRNLWQDRSSRFRQVVKTALILVPTVFVLGVACSLYKAAFGRNSYWDKQLSDNITAHSFVDDRYRIYDERAEKYTTRRLDWVSEAAAGDSLAVYALSDRRGFVNVNTGRIVIDAKDNDYSKAWVFSEGVAAVVRDGKVGFINADNEVVIPFQFDCPEWYVIDYVFHNGYCTMNDSEGRLGLIDKSGAWVVEPIYSGIWAPQKRGLRLVLQNSKYGVIESDGTLVFAPQYDDVKILSDGFIFTNEGRMWQVDLSGNITKPFMFDYIYPLLCPYSYSASEDVIYMLSDYARYEVGCRCGILCRSTGKPITPAIYSDVKMLSDSVFQVESDDEWHLLDLDGNFIKP